MTKFGDDWLTRSWDFVNFPYRLLRGVVDTTWLLRWGRLWEATWLWWTQDEHRWMLVRSGVFSHDVTISTLRPTHLLRVSACYMANIRAILGASYTKSIYTLLHKYSPPRHNKIWNFGYKHRSTSEISKLGLSNIIYNTSAEFTNDDNLVSDTMRAIMCQVVELIQMKSLQPSARRSIDGCRQTKINVQISFAGTQLILHDQTLSTK